MKTLKRLLFTSLASFTIFYIGGSLMQADLNISHWDEATRNNLFGVALTIVIIAEVAKSINKALD